MTDEPDPFQLQRFTEAQRGTFETAMAELRSGKKQSHWMWFIFPQLAGLGRSRTAQFYGIRSISEARAYLAHPQLGPRYRQAVEAVLAWSGQRSAAEIFGDVDAMKLRSSLTLFCIGSRDAIFRQTLETFFEGPDAATMQLIEEA